MVFDLFIDLYSYERRLASFNRKYSVVIITYTGYDHASKYRCLAIHFKIMYIMWVDAFKIQQIFFLTHQYLEKWVSLLEEIIVLREQNKQCKFGKID